MMMSFEKQELGKLSEIQIEASIHQLAAAHPLENTPFWQTLPYLKHCRRNRQAQQEHGVNTVADYMIKKIEMAAINDPNKISNQISERKGVMHGEDQLRI